MIVPATPTSHQHAARMALVLAWAVLVALALVGLPLGSPSARAGTFVPPKKTVTYLVTIKVDGTTVVGPFSSTETVTGSIVANPVGTGSDPTAWEGQGTLDFGPIVNTGLPAGCQLTTIAPTGTMHVAVVKSGESVTVNWSPNSSPITPSTVTCPGIPAGSFIGGAPAEPFALLEPREFTVAAAGGTQALNGKLSTADGIMENVGTMTVTRRETCGEKVKAVTTYPPGQATSASSMVGKAFGVGEKVTADTNVEFVFEDGSVIRLAKGSSFKETPNCDATQDKSKDYKGTLLLGKIWFHVSSLFGDVNNDIWACYQWGTWATKVKVPCERTVTGHRGTTYWVDPGKRKATYSVSEGSIWVQAMSATNRPASKQIIVKAGRTLVLSKKADPVLRKTKPSDAFPFGGPVG